MTDWEQIHKDKRRHIIRGMAMKRILEEKNPMALIAVGDEAETNRIEFIKQFKALDKFLWETYDGETTTD